MVQDRVRCAARRADLERQGVHILRHTFCSHLAMRGDVISTRACSEALAVRAPDRFAGFCSVPYALATVFHPEAIISQELDDRQH